MVKDYGDETVNVLMQGIPVLRDGKPVKVNG